MKKFLSCFLFVFGFVMLCNLSFAATFTFEEGKYQVYAKYYSESSYNTYLDDLNNLENLTPNYSSPSFSDLTIDDTLLEKYPYILFYDNTGSGSSYKYLFILSDVPLLATNGQNVSTKGYLINGALGIVTPKDTLTNYMYAYCSNGSWSISSEKSTSDRTSVGGSLSCKPIYYANYDVYHYLNSTLVYKSASAEEQLPSMENTFSNDELRDIHNRLNNTDVLKDYLPANYNSYFITHNENSGQYKAFFYPDTWLPYAKVYPEGYTHVDGNVYDYSTYSLGIGVEEDFNNGKYNTYFNHWYNCPIYCFVSFGSSSDFWHHSTIDDDEMSTYINSFDDVPIIFSTKDFYLYYVDEEGNIVLNSDNELDESSKVVIPATTLTDEEGGDVSTDVEIGEKDTTSLWTLISGIPEAILNGIKAIFVPSEDFISEKVNSIMYRLSFYTSLQETYESLISTMTSDSQGAPQITVDFGLSEDSVLANCGTASVLDFSWYAKFKPAVDLFIIAFVYGVFIWRFIVELPNTISGFSNAFDYEPMQVEDKSGDKHFAIRNRNTSNVRRKG